MFDVGWSEMLVVGAVALIVIGPKDLPAALRTLGQSIGKIRRMAGEFRQQFDEAMREAELDKIKEDLVKAEADARAAADVNFNPVETAKQEIQAAMEDKPAPAPDAAAPAAETGAPPAADLPIDFAPPPAADLPLDIAPTPPPEPVAADAPPAPAPPDDAADPSRPKQKAEA